MLVETIGTDKDNGYNASQHLIASSSIEQSGWSAGWKTYVRPAIGVTIWWLTWWPRQQEQRLCTIWVCSINFSCTVIPPKSAFINSSLVALLRAFSANCLARFTNDSFFPTKSVSQPNTITAPMRDRFLLPLL